MTNIFSYFKVGSKFPIQTTAILGERRSTQSVVCCWESVSTWETKWFLTAGLWPISAVCLNSVYCSCPPTRTACTIFATSSRSPESETPKTANENAISHFHSPSDLQYHNYLRLMRGAEFRSDNRYCIWIKSKIITIDELVKLRPCSGDSCFTPPGSFPVTYLIAGDLPILATQGWRLPPKHDALRRE